MTSLSGSVPLITLTVAAEGEKPSQRNPPPQKPLAVTSAV